MNDRIEKLIELKVPLSKVWDALTDYHQFGEWFQVQLEGPFVVGKPTRGRITMAEYAEIPFLVDVKKMEPQKLFSYTWHPYAIDPNQDYSKESPTLVEFKLEKANEGTLLLVIESGFDKIPEARRVDAFNMNNMGWNEQLKNIQKYLQPIIP